MFAGIGGFRSGLAKFGDFFVPVGFCEIDPYKIMENIFMCAIRDAMNNAPEQTIINRINSIIELNEKESQLISRYLTQY